MCGISGFNFNDAKLARAMNRSLAHRGPDHEDLYLDERVNLGHRRLSIIDLSDSSNQPMTDEDERYWLTYNGEVYNFPELRSELQAKGARFHSRGDSEVVLHGYRLFGTEFLKRLNGMFALAIYDRELGQLLLARDPFGIKPLYYFWDEKRFIFASEIKAILEHDVPRRIHPGALSEYFTFRFTLGPQTLFDGVSKLPPGSFLKFDLNRQTILETGTYWRRPVATGVSNDPDGLARELKERFTEAVRIRLVSDVPLGFFLSGGIDSTILLATAKRLGAEVRSFSAGFETTNELAFARIAADRFSDSHREVRIGDEALELLEPMVYHMDEPVGDAAFLALMVLSREAAKEVKVVLAGEGADELFAGYDRYKAFLFGNRVAGRVPDALRSWLPRKLGSENLSRLLRLLGESAVDRRYLEIIRLFSREELEAFGVEDGVRALSKVPVNGSFAEHPLDAALFFDLQTLLPNDFFQKADKMSSAYGLEMRVPFLDPGLVDLSFAVPPELKLRGWNEKYLLRRAFADEIPPVIARRRKQGFNVPMDHWLRGPLADKLKKMLSEPAHDLYHLGPALALLEGFRRGEGSYKSTFYNAQKLWSILVFELWYRRFLA